MLIASALLFNSIYKAVVVGLTLTVFPADTITIKVANIIGGFGGVLIFFTSVTTLIEYILASERRDEHIKELARSYLEKKKG